MINSVPLWRIRLAQIIWITYGLLWLLLGIGSPYSGTAGPYSMALPLLATALLALPVVWPISQRLANIALSAAALELGLALLVISGPGLSGPGGRESPLATFTLPLPVRLVLLVVGIILPAAVTYYVLRNLGQHSVARGEVGAA
jgi:hypothetical protein